MPIVLGDPGSVVVECGPEPSSFVDREAACKAYRFLVRHRVPSDGWSRSDARGQGSPRLRSLRRSLFNGEVHHGVLPRPSIQAINEVGECATLIDANALGGEPLPILVRSSLPAPLREVGLEATCSSMSDSSRSSSTLSSSWRPRSSRVRRRRRAIDSPENGRWSRIR